LSDDEIENFLKQRIIFIKMDSEKIWKEGEWTNEARQIIDGLNEFPDNSKIILI